MTEAGRFPPAVVRWLAEAAADPEAFWGRAAEALPWFRRWDRVFEPDPPSFRWFVGGRTNLAHNALDRHVAAGDGERLALIAVNERGERRDLTYRGLLDEVERVAAAVRSLGIQRGDRVTLYLPTCPEAIVAMLAIVRTSCAGRSSPRSSSCAWAARRRRTFAASCSRRFGTSSGPSP